MGGKHRYIKTSLLIIVIDHDKARHCIPAIVAAGSLDSCLAKKSNQSINPVASYCGELSVIDSQPAIGGRVIFYMALRYFLWLTRGFYDFPVLG